MSPSTMSPSSQTRRSRRGISLPWTSASRFRPNFALPARHSPEWTPLLASGALLLTLALQIALPLRTPLPIDSALAPRRARPPAETPLPTYSALLQNPLFAPDRSPGGTSVAGAKGPGSLDQLTVVGIAMRRGAATVIVKGTDGTSQVLKPGEEIAGWRLSGVAPTYLVFLRGSERRILTLDPRKAATAGQNAAQQSNDDEDDEEQR
jgi:hypothetical protein